MNIEGTQEIADELRGQIGKDQVMLILNTGTQIPVVIEKVGRNMVTTVASMQVAREIMGQAVTQEIPWRYVIALETIIGIGYKAGGVTTEVVPDLRNHNGKG